MSLPHKHPSLTCYQHHGCRCGECKLLGSAARKRRIQNKAALVAKPHNHPSLSCYKTHGCRCPECTELCRQSRYAIPDVLPIAEVKRLRRMLGLPEDVTPTNT